MCESTARPAVNVFTDSERKVVLVGGGHAHVLVLEELCRRPLAVTRVSLVVDQRKAIYSGMVPGFVAGEYARGQLEIDVVSLARRANVEVILEAACAIDPERRCIRLAGGGELAYDVASLDVGSTVRGLDLPGVREWAVATRPIASFVDQIDTRVRHAVGRRDPLEVAVIGTGIAGIELAFTLEARLRALGVPSRIRLLGREELPNASSAGWLRHLQRLAAARNIVWQGGFELTGVEPDAVLANDRREPAELVVLASGAAPHPWLRAAPLPLDVRGFVGVTDTLQVSGFPSLFAAGDCASLLSAAWVPKAGVYAVRQGPVLAANLRAWLGSEPLRRYTPQRDFLALLNLGERRALAVKWGFRFEGRLAWKLKDGIDRAFMRRFAPVA